MNRSISILTRRSRGLRAALPAALALVALAAAACGGTTPASTDPYTIAGKAFDAAYDQVKVQVGIKTSGGTSDIAIDPGAIELVLDTKAGKGSFHLSLPVAALGSDAASLRSMGITGDTLDLDVLWDGQALYAKSPLAASLIPALLAQSGQTVSGDLTGWLKLGTADEFGALAKQFAGTPEASAPASTAPIGDLDPAALKKDLEDSGIVVTYVGSETRNGVEADHLTLTLDPAKLASGPAAQQLPAAQLNQLTGLAGSETLSADLWLDKASGRLTEIYLHGASQSGEKADVTILLSTPRAPRSTPLRTQHRSRWCPCS